MNPLVIFGIASSVASLGAMGYNYFKSDDTEKEPGKKSIGNSPTEFNVDFGQGTGNAKTDEINQAYISKILGGLDGTINELLNVGKDYSSLSDPNSAMKFIDSASRSGQLAINSARKGVAIARATALSLIMNPQLSAQIGDQATKAVQLYSASVDRGYQIENAKDVLTDSKASYEAKKNAAMIINANSGLPIDAVLKNNQTAMQAYVYADSLIKGKMQMYASSSKTETKAIKDNTKEIENLQKFYVDLRGLLQKEKDPTQKIKLVKTIAGVEMKLESLNNGGSSVNGTGTNFVSGTK